MAYIKYSWISRVEPCAEVIVSAAAGQFWSAAEWRGLESSLISLTCFNFVRKELLL